VASELDITHSHDQGKRSAHRPRIGLLVHGGTEWIGGELYMRNLFLALLRYKKKLPKSRHYKIVIIHPDPSILCERNPIFREADELVSCPRMNAGPSGKLSLFFQLVFHRIDFAYPCNTPMPPWPRLHTCAWIVDFQYAYFPALFSHRELRRRRLSSLLVAYTMSHVVLSSEHARQDFLRLYPSSRARSHVLHFHSLPDESIWQEDPEEVRQMYFLPSRFLICSGQFWAHKNHLLLLEALAAALSDEPDLFLVFTGHPVDLRNPSYLNSVLARISRLGLRGCTAILGLIPRQHQLQLMRIAVSVVQPSLFEGWSTVVEDARTFDKSIVLSDITVHLEQKAPNAHVFSATSVDDLRCKILLAWQNQRIALSPEDEANARTQAILGGDEMAINFLNLIEVASRG
jgi:glycosyltransferase involved in cell wall biosynthesis